MKNHDEFSVLKRKVLTHSQLLDLRGGADPGAGCAPGESLWMCNAVPCVGCNGMEGDICATSSDAAIAKFKAYYPEPEWDIACEPGIIPD